MPTVASEPALAAPAPCPSLVRETSRLYSSALMSPRLPDRVHPLSRIFEIVVPPAVRPVAVMGWGKGVVTCSFGLSPKYRVPGGACRKGGAWSYAKRIG